jgi:hypothetical protein
MKPNAPNKNNRPKTFITYEGMLSDICAQNVEYLARRIRNAETIDFEASESIHSAIQAFNEALLQVSHQINTPLSKALPKMAQRSQQ